MQATDRDIGYPNFCVVPATDFDGRAVNGTDDVDCLCLVSLAADLFEDHVRSVGGWNMN
jgi:hypothetical protein